jgi:hypothetical protein
MLWKEDFKTYSSFIRILNQENSCKVLRKSSKNKEYKLLSFNVFIYF